MDWQELDEEFRFEEQGAKIHPQSPSPRAREPDLQKPRRRQVNVQSLGNMICLLPLHQPKKGPIARAKQSIESTLFITFLINKSLYKLNIQYHVLKV